MAAGGGATVTDWEDVFSDKLGLSERFTAHSRIAGEQTPVEQPAAREPPGHMCIVMNEEELRDQRLELVATYDLTVDPRQFCYRANPRAFTSRL